MPTWRQPSDTPSPVPTRPRSGTPSSGGAAPLSTWLRELVRPSTPDSEFGDDDAYQDGPGSFLCALPPITDPFWRSTDLAEHARTALSTLQRERQLLLAKLRSQKSALTTSTASVSIAATAANEPQLKAALAEQAAAAAKREERCAPT